MIDGTVIEAHNVREWQQTIGYVPQHIFLADDTVAANIAFGVPPNKIDMQTVERVARIAELHSFVAEELPQGYMTRVGERGVRLSGGQRQRIGIARALYHEPEVLVFDEATSALDNLTERAVMDAMQNLTHQKTILIIAHRLSTVRACDQLLLLDHGKIKAVGTYDELVKADKAFFQAEQEYLQPQLRGTTQSG
jgi:ABC-type multidrug transport system fused ATPase/permease subunit